MFDTRIEKREDFQLEILIMTDTLAIPGAWNSEWEEVYPIATIEGGKIP